MKGTMHLADVAHKLLTTTLFLALLGVLSPAEAQSPKWVTAYYAGWIQGNQWSWHLKPEEIDFDALTHLIHFSVIPTSTGGVSFTEGTITPENSEAATRAAHAAKKKILICVGGWGIHTLFEEATAPPYLEKFVDNLVRFAGERGYDGIDVDWEPVTNHEQYRKFIPMLRAAMDRVNPRWLLTTAVSGVDPAVVEMKDYFDQINLMTYDMSGAWPGWITWHNAPIFDSGTTFPSTGGPLPSANRTVDDVIAQGVEPEKLGIGIDFYGYVWTGGHGTPTGGVTGPRQSWTTDPGVQDNVPYHAILDHYFAPSLVRWDSLAEASYLSIDKPGSKDDIFVSYDSEKTCEKKLEYAQRKGLGGVFIWELGGGFRKNADQPPKDPLLQAVKRAAQAIFHQPKDGR